MEEEAVIWKSDTDSMASVLIGRAMSTLLTCRPRKLDEAISRLDSPSKRGSIVSLEDSLWFLHRYIKEAADKEERLDEILVPMIEHSLKCKESKHGNQAMVLLNWLFQDELLFQALARGLADIISRKEDRYIALGWCTLVRGLVEYEITMDQFSNNGIRKIYNAMLKILCSCISRLSFIVCNGSTVQDGFELPTRLSVAAADCILDLTKALTRKTSITDVSSRRSKSSNSDVSNLPTTLVPAAVGEKKVKPTSKSAEFSNKLEMELLLWDHIDKLIILVQRLLAWSRKSRPLHAKGLEQVLNWLQEIKEHYGCSQDEAGSTVPKAGVLLLSSCWKHYAMLLHLEDKKFSQQYKDLLDQYLSAIQFYTDSDSKQHTKNTDTGIATRKFFLNCLSLLLGRLDGKQIERTVTEYGMQISRALIPQLCCTDEDVIDGVVCIFKKIIFKMNYSSSGSSLSDTRQMDSVLPLLLPLLDERDGTAKAVVMLVAEYCSINPNGQCLDEVLERLASGNASQRRNAVDVISELIHISSNSVTALSHSMWQDISKHLLECLGDEDEIINVQASNLLPKIDPLLVLPALVRLVYSSNERVQSSASDAMTALLKNHNQNYEVLSMLLDSLSNLSQSLGLPKTSGYIEEGSKLDTEKVLGLIPEWSESVQDWNLLIGPLIDKMFAEPSNATLVRFLSYISEHLAEAADIVFHRILLHMKGQKELDESFFTKWESKTYAADDSMKLQHSLFDRLCPLLVIRLLPMRVFNDLNSSVIYGQLPDQVVVHGYGLIDINDHECVAMLLLNRALGKFEFEDVRKLAAELCGRIHPQVLLPILSSHLELAADSQDIVKIKACLFSVCTSLVARGRDSLSQPAMLKIQKTIKTILLWPSLDGDEVSKAQHGCIDCLALMICTELQAPKSFIGSVSDKISIIGKNFHPGDSALGDSVVTYVIHQLSLDAVEAASTSMLCSDNCASEPSVTLSFRLCMANVLISACQKISDSGKKAFARRILPYLIHLVQVIKDSEIRVACVQVLFSAVYHLKSMILPYSSELLKLSLKSLEGNSEKERMAGVKLMASLMASEDAIVENISEGLLEARLVLLSMYMADPSLEVQQMCQKLLACFTHS